MTEPQIELEHEFSLDIDYNPSRWLELPPRWDTEEWQDIGAWAHSCAELFWRSYGQDPGTTGISFLAGRLRQFAEAFAPEPFDTRVLLRMWEPTSMPLQVCAMVKPAEGDREETLRFLVGADDSDAVEPPVVESFQTELLGEGLRAFRYLRQDDTPEVLAALRYAWRVEEVGADVVLWTATDDTAQVIRAAPDIEELTDTMSVAVWELAPEDEDAPPNVGS
ncbi:hypothetical protein ACIHCM_35775 [Streptomyces sp. NPDC052023]|uniref:hypothetical protein n=1 Tax=Streptomyces sp. NPDC052023 TaxID=3365681 RepID=UPI0037D7BE1B